jgi:Protein of unknown function (DUF493)
MPAQQMRESLMMHVASTTSTQPSQASHTVVQCRASDRWDTWPVSVVMLLRSAMLLSSLMLRRSAAFVAQGRIAPVAQRTLGRLFSSQRHDHDAAAHPESAQEKLLPKIAQDGSVKFDNPNVGDFQVFDTCIKYPCYFDLKVVGEKKGDFPGDMQRCVANVLQQDPEKVSSLHLFHRLQL